MPTDSDTFSRSALTRTLSFWYRPGSSAVLLVRGSSCYTMVLSATDMSIATVRNSKDFVQDET